MEQKDEVTQNNLSIAQNAFIAAFIAEMGNVARACARAKVSERAYYYWRKQPEFSDAFFEARQAASQSLRDMVYGGFSDVFNKATAELLINNTETEEEGDTDKPKRKPLPTLRGAEYVNMGKELMVIADKIAPEEKAVSQDANNFLDAVNRAVESHTPTPLHESVGDFDPNNADGEDEDEEEADE